MRKLLCALAVLTAFTVTPARAHVTNVLLLSPCQLVSTTDVTRSAGWQVGVLAGEVVKDEPGTLICQVHVNDDLSPRASQSAHTEGASTVNVAVVAGTVDYEATAADYVSI